MTYHLPLPGEEFDGGTVIASVWVRDDEEPITALLLLLMPNPPFYRLVDITADRTRQWRTDPTTDRSHPNIVPAVEDYQQNGGDY